MWPYYGQQRNKMFGYIAKGKPLHINKLHFYWRQMRQQCSDSTTFLWGCSLWDCKHKFLLEKNTFWWIFNPFYILHSLVFCFQKHTHGFLIVNDWQYVCVCFFFLICHLFAISFHSVFRRMKQSEAGQLQQWESWDHKTPQQPVTAGFKYALACKQQKFGPVSVRSFYLACQQPWPKAGCSWVMNNLRANVHLDATTSKVKDRSHYDLGCLPRNTSCLRFDFQRWTLTISHWNAKYDFT